MVRCVNLHFPHAAQFYQVQNEGFVLYESDGMPTSIYCSLIRLTATSSSFQSPFRLTLQHDVVLKNTIIKFLQKVSEEPQEISGEIQSPDLPVSLVNSLQNTIQLIRDPQMYLRLLDDCFRYGVDLSRSYKILLSICSQQVQRLWSQLSSGVNSSALLTENEDRKDKAMDDELGESPPFSDAKEAVDPSQTADNPLFTSLNPGDEFLHSTEDVLQRLLFYSSLISWYFSLLNLFQQREESHKSQTSFLIDQSSCELLQFQKSYENQFVTAPESPAPAFTYKDLSLWLQCIQITSSSNTIR